METILCNIMLSNYTQKMFIALLTLLMLLSVEAQTASISDEKTTIKIKAIVDVNSRMGKEQKTAMQFAVESFNNGSGSRSHSLSLSFTDYNGRGLLQTLFQVQKLVEENQVQVLITGLDNWQATSLIAQIGSQAQVPTFSLVASPPIPPSLPYSRRFPFLIQMARDDSEQTRRLVSIIQAYLWKRVVVVSEADPDGGDIGALSVLSKALQNVGSQVENHLILPTFASITNPNTVVKEVFSNFLYESCYARVFIVLKVSPGYVSPLFKQAKEMGLMKNDSAWIITQAISNLLPCCLNASTLQNMEGALGLMTKFDNSTTSFEKFHAQFWTTFSEKHPEENGHFDPSFHALLAYDTISTVITSLSRLTNNHTSGHDFLTKILQSSFSGLTGQISFNQKNNTLSNTPNMKLVNIVDENYKDIFDFPSEDIEDENLTKRLSSEMITWPGDFTGGVPKGWMMPTQDKPMRIGVPISQNFDNFVNHTCKNQRCEFKSNGNITRLNEEYIGFCPELFRKVVNAYVLGYDLPYQFLPFRGSYDDLVKSVHNKTYDAAVGDITILADRSELVDFTLPYEPSTLSLVLPVGVAKPYNSDDPLIFLMPFNGLMWGLILILLVYTMLVVWYLEAEQEENGEWTKLSTAIWFAFSSIFFVHKEKITSNLARIVVVTWLFLVLVLTSSYTANLTSMLTIARLNQTTTDIETLRRSNAKVGYDSSSFMREFLVDLFHFNQTNLLGIQPNFIDIHRNFKEEIIKAAFMEVLYAKLFVTKYCKQYTISSTGYRFGGLAFAFPKGSPVTKDVSLAILKLIEDKEQPVKELENHWLNATSNHCYASADDFTANNGRDDRNSSLSLKSFWILFTFSGVTSTLCLLASHISSRKDRSRRVDGPHAH